jgi:hypothetical protein
MTNRKHVRRRLTKLRLRAEGKRRHAVPAGWVAVNCTAPLSDRPIDFSRIG